MKRIRQMERTDRRNRTWFIISGVLLLGSFSLSLINNKRLIRQHGKVEHTFEVINTLEKIISFAREGEAGMRGFLLTNDSGFYNDYVNGIRLRDSFMLTFKQLTEDNPYQKSHTLTLEKILTQRAQDLKNIHNAYIANNYRFNDSIKALLLNNRSWVLNARKQVTSLRKHENILLAQRKKDTEKTNGLIDTISFTSLAFALGLIAFTFITYKKEHKWRKKAYHEIGSYQEELQLKVEELKTTNEALVQMKRQEKFAATGRIARQIAHEVRNPLTNINLATSQLKEDLPNINEDNMYMFEIINRNSERINQLISDLLTSTKFAELHFEQRQINEVILETIELSKDRAELKNITIVTKLDDTLAPLNLDTEKMKIALLNLIVNAIEAMEDVPHPELQIITKKKMNKVLILIKDNGKGMDATMIERVFEPYFTNKQKGNGLGLTNTQNIILNHKGQINVSSTPEKGTEFSILL